MGPKTIWLPILQNEEDIRVNIFWMDYAFKVTRVSKSTCNEEHYNQ